MSEQPKQPPATGPRSGPGANNNVPPGVIGDPGPVSRKRGEHRPLALVKTDPNAKKDVRLSDVRAYFALVSARAQQFYRDVREAAEACAAKNGGTDEARLGELRLQYLALEEALELVDAHIARLKKKKPAETKS